MRTHIFVFSEKGARLALRVREYFKDSAVHSIERLAAPYGFAAHRSVPADMEPLFKEAELLVFIGACGIAVRSIAPYVKSKAADPAVLVIDDAGTFVILILSGHIGGANRMARGLAGYLGAVPVITTATDIAGRFSVDAWAAEHAFVISSMDAAKRVSAAILETDVPVTAEKPLSDSLPVGLAKADGGTLGIYIGIRCRSPYDETLRLVPRAVTLGIGCRRGVSEAAIRETAASALDSAGLDFLSVGHICSIDAKRDEAGLLSFCESLGIAPEFYSAAELAAVKGEFEESEFVRTTVGVGNVCERAAMIRGGTLIVPKYAAGGVTAAASEADWRISFE